MSAPQTRTLIGFLGKDREIRITRERTYTKTVHNKVIDGDEEIEVHVPSRSYMKLSLATHERSASGTDLDHNRVADIPERFDDSPRRVRVD